MANPCERLKKGQSHHQAPNNDEPAYLKNQIANSTPRDGGPRLAAEVSQSEQILPFYCGMSMLKDGSVPGLLGFSNPVQRMVL
jgi:hypothetical protein